MLSEDCVRTRILLPRDLLQTIDRLVGQRGRSRFLAEAAMEKLERLDKERRTAERLAAARAAMGSLADNHIPEWATQESADQWVREGRRGWDERLDEIWARP
jgi:metal-responsive CopG/Arc/MetJ family transcriptional regulator